jgi:drug/metabolite transporter (DMT)-like permease
VAHATLQPLDVVADEDVVPRRRQIASSFVGIAVNIVALVLLVIWAVAVHSLIWSPLILIAACGAALYVVVNTHLLRQSWTREPDEEQQPPQPLG